MKTTASTILVRVICAFLPLVLGAGSHADDTGSTDRKTFIDYFQPIPIIGTLSKSAWGAQTVGARDQQNGMEDPTLAQWNYWDGRIIKTADGKYHFFGSRWEQSKGHFDWIHSNAIHAVSDNLFGPYVDKGLCWPGDQGGKGHNVTALVLPDGTYAIVVSETRPGEVFTSTSPNGPWKNIGRIKVADNEFKALAKMSNVCPMVRPDGNIEIIARSGAIWISKNGILGPYTVQGPSIYPAITALDQKNLEDPVMWYSGGLYHVVVNSWSDRKAFHITSVDGINDWKYQGVAYDPTKDFIRYTDGTINHWNKLERPSVYLENGHVVAVTLAAIDVPKEQERGNDGHGSKIIVIPFDGAAMDKDLQPTSNSSGLTSPTSGSISPK
jgi:hypothetical protein